MKCVWVLLLVALALLLRTASNQEDMTEEEMEEQPTPGPEGEQPTQPPFQPPERPSGDVYFAEPFTDTAKVWRQWVPSKATKDGGEAKYDGKG